MAIALTNFDRSDDRSGQSPHGLERDLDSLDCIGKTVQVIKLAHRLSHLKRPDFQRFGAAA